MSKPLFTLLLFCLLALGAVLRFQGIQRQVILGDELHTVRVVAEHSLPAVLTNRSRRDDRTYRRTDNCIPLTAIYHIMSEWKPVTEMDLRIPILASGLLLMIIAPWVIRHQIGNGAALILCGLLAISPMLVLYSRIVRPYMPIILLSFIAVAAFYRWIEKRSRWSAVVYALFSALAIYFHLTAATFVLAPFVFLAACYLTRYKKSVPSLRSAALLLLVVLLLIAGFTAPAFNSLLALIEIKSHQGRFEPAALVDAAKLHVGTRSLGVTLAVLATAIGGWIILVRNMPRFASYGMTLVVIHVVGLVVVAPYRVQEPVVFHRYLLVVLPLTLVCVSVCLWSLIVGMAERTSWFHPRRLLTVALLTALVGTSPLLESRYRSSSFTHHNDFVDFSNTPATKATANVPAFYQRLRSMAFDGPIIEAPSVVPWRFLRSYYIYQEVHEKNVILAAPGFMAKSMLNRIGLQTLIIREPEMLLNSGARFLIVHLKLPEEEGEVVWKGDDEPNRGTPLKYRQLMSILSRDLITRCQNAWGEADERDGSLLIWDLERVRKGQPQPSVTGEVEQAEIYR